MSGEDLEKLRTANRLADEALASGDLGEVIEILDEINALLDTIKPEAPEAS